MGTLSLLIVRRDEIKPDIQNSRKRQQNPSQPGQAQRSIGGALQKQSVGRVLKIYEADDNSYNYECCGHDLEFRNHMKFTSREQLPGRRLAYEYAGQPITPKAGQKGRKTHFISSLIASWGSKTEQTQAQSGSEPY